MMMMIKDGCGGEVGLPTLLDLYVSHSFSLYLLLFLFLERDRLYGP